MNSSNNTANGPNINTISNQTSSQLNQLNSLQTSSVQKLILYKTSNSPNATKAPEPNSTGGILNTPTSTATTTSTTSHSSGSNNSFLNHLNGV